MVTLAVIFGIFFIFIGMIIAVTLFGTGVKRAKIFKDIYFTEEDIDGFGVIYTKVGEYSAVIKMENPVQKYCSDVDSYYEFLTLMNNIMMSIGEGYALHKQDIFVRKTFEASKLMDASHNENNFLRDSYFRFMDGRKYVDQDTYLIITQENKRGLFGSYDHNKWKDFLVKVNKVLSQLHDGGIRQARFLKGKECQEFAERFYCQNYKDSHPMMTSLKVDSEGIQMGDRQVRVFSLLDVDSVGLPGKLSPFMNVTVNNSPVPMDIMTALDSIQDVDTLVYNQIIYFPGQKMELARLEKKKNRHMSIPNPGNRTAAKDISDVLDVIARDSKQLVYAHFNLVVTCDKTTDMQKVANQIDNILSRQNMHLSKRAYNQLELFVGSFPGNCYRLNAEYDRFLTLSEAALCLMYKECQSKSEDTKMKYYCTDRNGVPLAIDITGKEGKVKYTDNSNFFVLGPSGSGKSFFMNTVVRQYYEQNTDVIIIDTGDSYEGLCDYFGGTYISYSKEHPISMNPFKITPREFNENFGEKKLFLSNLIFLIFHGNKKPEDIEKYIINTVISEYYREYFTPFQGYTDYEREQLRKEMLLQAKKDGSFEEFEDDIEKQLAKDNEVSEEDRERYEKLKEREEKLQAKIDDDASTEGEKDAAQKRKEEAHNELMRMTDIVERKYGQLIERKIAQMESRRKKLRVQELSFNSFYEYAIQRIPEITHDEHITFPINEFAAILKTFYRGGELEYTLNNDMDSSLFDERLIIFEIDKVKDDPVLFPIIVLIIMDVFTQKMRLKKDVRKCMVIEEAWKAIATPTMAEYIKYLYKTVRKFWGIVGVVTQELGDIISSPIVKEAIINNSDVFMLLDQAKFKEKFTDIKETLALSDVECKKIFTINRLDNKEGRSPFKEIFIKRVDTSDVFGIEESIECYMSYTTEKVEKEALKIYKRVLKCNHQKAIEAFVADFKASGKGKTLDFAMDVMAAGAPIHTVNG